MTCLLRPDSTNIAHIFIICRKLYDCPFKIQWALLNRRTQWKLGRWIISGKALSWLFLLFLLWDMHFSSLFVEVFCCCLSHISLNDVQEMTKLWKAWDVIFLCRNDIYSHKLSLGFLWGSTTVCNNKHYSRSTHLWMAPPQWLSTMAVHP